MSAKREPRAETPVWLRPRLVAGTISLLAMATCHTAPPPDEFGDEKDFTERRYEGSPLTANAIASGVQGCASVEGPMYPVGCTMELSFRLEAWGCTCTADVPGGAPKWLCAI